MKACFAGIGTGSLIFGFIKGDCWVIANLYLLPAPPTIAEDISPRSATV